MSEHKKDDFRSQLTVSVTTAVVTAALTGLVVHTQLRSEHRFAETSRQLALQEKRNDKKVQLADEITALLAEYQVRRNASTLNYLALTVAFGQVDRGQKNFEKVFSDAMAKYLSDFEQLQGKTAKLRSLLTQAGVFFGPEVQHAIGAFAQTVHTMPDLPSIKALEKAPASLTGDRETLRQLYGKVTSEMENDPAKDLSREIVSAMATELLRDISAHSEIAH